VLCLHVVRVAVKGCRCNDATGVVVTGMLHLYATLLYCSTQLLIPISQLCHEGHAELKTLTHLVQHQLQIHPSVVALVVVDVRGIR
jgi:hypothetical protein